MNFNINNIATTIGLDIPKNILVHLENAYGKEKTIEILSETIGYDIHDYLVDFNNEPNNCNDVKIRTNSYDSSSENDYNDDIQIMRDNFYKKYMENFNNINLFNIDIKQDFETFFVL